MPSYTGDLFAGQPATGAETPARPDTADRSDSPAGTEPPARSGSRSRRSAAALPGSAAAAAGPEAWALTAHCDGGARGNPGPAGFGAEIRDASGMVVAELSEFLGICSNNVAEYRGLLACLQYALDHGAPSLRVVSDSLLMVKQVQGSYKVKSPDLLPLWQEARGRIKQLQRFEISHALRHKNKAADRLANEAMDRGTKRPHAPGTPAPAPLRATPYPQPQSAPAAPHRLDPAAPQPVSIVRNGGVAVNPKEIGAPARQDAAAASGAMLRGFSRDGVIHILGGHTLPDGRFVKIIPE